MALTEKGKYALEDAQKYFPTGQFSAAELSDACGEKIFAATLNGVVNNGLMNKITGTPMKYELVDNLLEILETFQSTSCTNSNLRSAKRNKNDEFYTRYEDIEAEVMRYRKQLKGKTIYLPCDDPRAKKSQFWYFFVNNFDAFGLKKLIATHYDEEGKAYKVWIDGDSSGDGWVDDLDAHQADLKGNGDFRSPECIEIMNECDIVITNPPFSLFREFISCIINANKKFLIIGNKNAFTYKEIFPLIKNNQIWTGYGNPTNFITEDGSVTKSVNGLCRWFTNLDTKKRKEELILTKNYNNIDYPKYDNYNAIEVSKVVDIPKDYDGVMGVPVTFLDKYNPDQFKIIGGFNGYAESHPEVGLICGDRTPYLKDEKIKYWTGPTVNKQSKYYRILIQKQNN